MNERAHSVNNSKISIVIITYNRPDDMFELAKNIASLKDVNSLVAEIVIVNNKSELNYDSLEKYINEHPEIPFKYFITTENLGVSRGRNYAIKKSTGSILIFLDDDALFENINSLQNIISIFSKKSEYDRQIGLASFKVYYHSTLTLQKTAFPHKQFYKRKHLHSFDAPYYVGCAHAILRVVFDSVGYYPENFFYGMEEYDLSFRALNAGFAIRYDDTVSILHKESPLGRITDNQKIKSMWVNKSKVIWKYLPKKYFYSTTILWSFQYLLKSNFHISGWLKIWKEIYKIPRKEKRTPITKECLLYLRKIKARLYY